MAAENQHQSMFDMENHPRNRTARQARPDRAAFGWTAVFIGVVGLTLTMLNAWVWSLIPWELARSGTWAFVVTLMIIAPFTLLLMLIAWALLALYQRLGIRSWPGPLQGLLATLTTVVPLVALIGLRVALYDSY